MSTFVLSRSSRLYTFVFGRQAHFRIEGFPEPNNNKISLGLFVGLFLGMTILRPLAFFFMTLFEIMMLPLCFLIDGSYPTGKFPLDMKIVKIEPWPQVFGRRVSPWLALAATVVGYEYVHDGTPGAVEVFIELAIVTLVSLDIKPGDKSLTMELAEMSEPVINEKLHRSYYQEPKYFPVLHLVP